MFNNSELKAYNLTSDGKMIGIVRYNQEVIGKEEMTRPFIHNGARSIISIGRVNYELLDSFIVNSLNNYYQNMNLTKNEETRKMQVANYQELYDLWQKVAIAKSNNDQNLNSYYDDLVYRLYLLGYRN